jgi:phospholipase C
MTGLLAVVTLLTAAAASSAPSTNRRDHVRARPASADAAVYKIKHVVIIMQENRSFDSYFGTYPSADGLPGLAGHPGSVPCVPAPQLHRCVRPFHDRQDRDHGAAHDVPASRADVAGGKMDGFVAEQERVLAASPCRCVPPAQANDVMGYHTGAEIPNYWTYARDFVLQDHMFEPVPSWSLVAHLYLVSLWSADCAKHNDPQSCKNAIENPGIPPYRRRHQGRPYPPPIFAWTDLTYLLYKHHVSWRYYIFKGIEPDCESDTSLSCAPVTQGPKTLGAWNPLAEFDTVKEDHQRGNIQSLNAFFAAATKGTLPAVSWVVPTQTVSEHAPALVSKGQTYVTGLINLIMQSPEWNSTAIFVAWDDWGGLYDNVPPPRVDKNGYGLRVPAFMISAYARQGYVDHQVLSFDAYAKFIEDDFLGGQRLDPRTDGRPDPRPDVRENASQLGNLLTEFDFSQPPLKPVLLPVHPKTDLKG